MKIHNRQELKHRRRDLRNFGTSAEAFLWLRLKEKQLEGRKFRRQHSIGKFVVDFYCPSEKLVVELDGEGHFTEEGRAFDEKRSGYLRSLGISVIRFENCEVFDRLDAVLEDIKKMFLTTPRRCRH
jgi:very-short-patch-repair endonuclease